MLKVWSESSHKLRFLNDSTSLDIVLLYVSLCYYTRICLLLSFPKGRIFGDEQWVSSQTRGPERGFHYSEVSRSIPITEIFSKTRSWKITANDSLFNACYSFLSSATQVTCLLYFLLTQCILLSPGCFSDQVPILCGFSPSQFLNLTFQMTQHEAVILRSCSQWSFQFSDV